MGPYKIKEEMPVLPHRTFLKLHYHQNHFKTSHLTPRCASRSNLEPKKPIFTGIKDPVQSKRHIFFNCGELVSFAHKQYLDVPNASGNAWPHCESCEIDQANLNTDT